MLLKRLPGILQISVGDADAYSYIAGNHPAMAILSAARDPWFVELDKRYDGMREGPTFAGKPITVRIDNHMALNMVDVRTADPKYYSFGLLDAGVQFVFDVLRANRPILIHCNEGKSRGPSVALLCLLKAGMLRGGDFDSLAADFKTRYYPDYSPSRGIEAWLQANWQSFPPFHARDLPPPPIEP